MGASIRLVRSLAPILGLGLAVVPVAGQSANSAADSMTSVLAGAYSAAQATQGETVFRNVCGNCHATAEFTGTAFMRQWAGRPVYQLYDQLRVTMPLDNPGGLQATDYLAVIAYVLKLNAYPAGDSALPADDAALRRIRFEMKTTQAGARD